MQRAAIVGLGILLSLLGCKGEVPQAVPGQKLGESDKKSPKDGAADFTPLQFADFTAYLDKPAGDEPTWTVDDAGIIHTTGVPRGYLYTNKAFGDFVFQCEFRYPPQEGVDDENKYNTGFLIYIPENEDHKKWPRSLEVQGRFDQVGLVKSNARDVTIAADNDQSAREMARKPIGEWNAIEIRSADGAVTAILNGTEISSCKPGELKSGYIGLQSEDFPVEFRSLRIKAE